MLQIINQIFEIKNKINGMGEAAAFERNINRLYAIFEDDGYIIQDPTNETYEPSRADCEASIVGNASSKMKITRTLKPIIYQKLQGNVQLQQKAVVIVEKI
jgi:hypothetical protein